MGPRSDLTLRVGCCGKFLLCTAQAFLVANIRCRRTFSVEGKTVGISKTRVQDSFNDEG